MPVNGTKFGRYWSVYFIDPAVSALREIVVLMAIDTEKRLELNREYYMGAWKFIHESLSSSF